MKTYEAGEQHDWTDLAALGEWIVAEQVGVVAKTRAGIHVPDNARMAVWVVYSCGPDVTRVAKGDRILFDGRPPHNVDGRIFAILNQENIIATLGMPALAAEQDESVPEVVPMPPPERNGKPRILMPS